MPAQAAMLDELRAVVAAAPFFAPLTPWGKPMSVRMTSAGRYGWFTDRKGYRYVDRHPDGQPWPPIPASVLAVWRALVSAGARSRLLPRQLLPRQARMGLHRDADENDFSWPVLSISLGDPARLPHGRHRTRRPDSPRSSSSRATPSSLAARRASPITGSTASASAARASCPRAAGST